MTSLEKYQRDFDAATVRIFAELAKIKGLLQDIKTTLNKHTTYKEEQTK